MTQTPTSAGTTIPKKKKDGQKNEVVGAAAVAPPTSSCGAQRGISVAVPGSPDTSRKKRKISQTAPAMSTQENSI
eukprot:4796686-Ditylum_brightwellii.AAC.1